MSLSDKILRRRKIKGDMTLWVSDVKEAIQKLKEELTTNKFYEDQRNITYADWLIETIDKIFGEKLTDGN